jgi:hypothetical protein
MPSCDICGISRETKNIKDCIAENLQLKNKLKKSDMLIMNLQLKLKFEQMKNKVYTDIIDSQTDIKLENIVQESEDVVYVYNFENGNIPVIVKDFAEKTDNYTINIQRRKIKKVDDDVIKSAVEDTVIEEEPKKQTKPYRSFKKDIKTSEKELGSKLEQHVANVEKEIDKIVYNNFDVSHKDISDKIDSLFTQIENSRIYTASLSSIKDLRKKLLGKLNLDEYTLLLETHIERLNTIFTDKNYNRKKISEIIVKSMTSLDMRLVYYQGYTNTTIELDDVQKLGLALDILIKNEKQFVPYDKKVFYSNIKNYGLGLFELQECIERCAINKYGFHNIIYLPKPKDLSDPYSFYTLDKNGPKRYWKMECRMDDFVTDFIDNVLPYCINLFRKIYKDVFSDNIYRSDYNTKSQIMEFDCEQLILNIILLANRMKVCKLFQSIIIKRCTFTCTELDKFNFHSDDKLQQKKYMSIESDDVDSTIRQLFDGIGEDDIQRVIMSR